MRQSANWAIWRQGSGSFAPSCGGAGPGRGARRVVLQAHAAKHGQEQLNELGCLLKAYRVAFEVMRSNLEHVLRQLILDSFLIL